MTPEQFCYWLQGYSELGGPAPLPEQWATICKHLAVVFNKKTPGMTLLTPPPQTGHKTGFQLLLEQWDKERERDRKAQSDRPFC